MRIHVLALQCVAPQRQRRKKDLLGESVACMRPAVVARFRGEIVKHLVHPAVLGVQDVLHVLFALRCRPRVHPARHFRHNVERLLVGRVRSHLHQSGHDLVQRVERRPHIHPLIEPVKKLSWKCAQVAVLIQLRLALGEAGHQLVRLLLHRVVSRSRIEDGAR